MMARSFVIYPRANILEWNEFFLQDQLFKYPLLKQWFINLWFWRSLIWGNQNLVVTEISSPPELVYSSENNHFYEASCSSTYIWSSDSEILGFGGHLYKKIKSLLSQMNHLSQQGRHFNFFLEGPNFLKFFNATGLLKNWKKKHFICSNLTLFIVPFFLFSLFFSFLSLFSFYSFFLFLFPRGGATAPQPPNDASVSQG